MYLHGDFHVDVLPFNSVTLCTGGKWAEWLLKD